MPKSRIEFWEEKLGRNVERDAHQLAQLKENGWTVLTLWECETRDQMALATFVDEVARQIRPPQ